MPVSDQKILMKMKNEIHKAEEHLHNPSKMKEHIRTVRLLTELLVEEESSTDEQEVMVKLQTEVQKSQPQQPTSSTERPVVNHGEANGDSIFDF